MRLNTAKLTPVQAAFVIRAPDLIVWYEVVEPYVLRTRDRKPARSYSDYYFAEIGRLRAHAGTVDVRPACIPEGVETLQSHDLWVRPPDEAVERCPMCVEAHPLP